MELILNTHFYETLIVSIFPIVFCMFFIGN